MTETHDICSGRLRATIRARGGEMIALSDADGPLLWHGGPEWPRHTPVLFPIVGRLADDMLIHEGVIEPQVREMTSDLVDRAIVHLP